jgi:hypothetical protein
MRLPEGLENDLLPCEECLGAEADLADSRRRDRERTAATIGTERGHDD